MVARQLDSKIVEAFLDLCYGRAMYNRPGRLDYQELRLLIDTLGRTRCPVLGRPLLDSGIYLPGLLFDLANTKSDAGMAMKVLERLFYNMH